MGRMRLLTGILCLGQRVHFYTLNDTDHTDVTVRERIIKSYWLALTAAMYTETVLTMPVTIFQRKMQTIVS